MKPVLRIPPLPASLALLGTALAVVPVIGIATLALLPLVAVGALLVGWVVVSLLLAWAGIEGMAALERWLERDPRFQR